MTKMQVFRFLLDRKFKIQTFFGIVFTISLTSSIKPMSNMRSASSKMKNCTSDMSTVPSSRNPFIRPGVATRIWHPLCKEKTRTFKFKNLFCIAFILFYVDLVPLSEHSGTSVSQADFDDRVFPIQSPLSGDLNRKFSSGSKNDGS